MLPNSCFICDKDEPVMSSVEYRTDMGEYICSKKCIQVYHIDGILSHAQALKMYLMRTSTHNKTQREG